MMWRKVRIGFLGAAAVLLSVVCGVSGHEDAEIDVNTAQLRTTRYVFFEIPAKRQVKPTDLSQLVEKYSLTKSPPKWKLARRTQSGIYAMTYNRVDSSYNAVLSSMHQHFLYLGLEELEERDVDPRTQSKIVAEIMGYLQSGDPRTAARRADEIVEEDSDSWRAQHARSSTTEMKP